VPAIAESAQGAGDEAVIACAFSEGRMLITEDRVFGELVYARGYSTAGVVFVEFLSRMRGAKPAVVVEAPAKLDAGLRGAITVIEPGRVRVGRSPLP